MLSSRMSVLLVLGVVALAGCLAPLASATTQPGNLCVVLYGAPGNKEYPWSSATYLSFNYDDTPAGPNGNAVTLIADGTATGTRVYTNKYGQTYNQTVSLFASGVDFNDLLLYLDGTAVDSEGLSWSVSPATQFPGHGPNDLRNEANIYTDGLGNIVEQDSFIQDVNSISFVSNVTFANGTAFIPITMSFDNPNAAAVDLVNCVGNILEDVNGWQPTPTTSGYPTTWYYSFYQTDGSTWDVTTNLTLTTGSSDLTVDSIGDWYQSVTAITGQRTYNYFSNYTSTSTVSSIWSTSSFPDQRLYPLADSINVPSPFPAYTMDNAPFIDYDGLGYQLASGQGQYADGAASGTKFTTWNTYLYGSDSAVAIEDSHISHSHFPNGALQQQILSS